MESKTAHNLTPHDLHASRYAEKTDTDKSILQVLLFYLKRKHTHTFKIRNCKKIRSCKKTFSPVCMSLVKLAPMNIF